ncbi:CPSF A subunit [Thecamonas trahens ATCC 50062]|uniref:CPSF A subunit n=1 Tax=Thecamonas trahens ATCC 50062 TaxID=461836 RepID=A0A0L0DTV8_THETB|nr:CPSF A subunit [Thecamonas trahens ATCC 50062]KNC55769.1 CPSF A subunit [Thecamonas trahens ATCC 50062]|eukprot:XP_013752852.1 CPSF A subunit [Thecamonas trahens ATCC 50062]
MPYLYHLTLTQPTYIPHCVTGSFSGEGKSELVTTTGRSLSLYTTHAESGALELMCATQAFGLITNLATFRLTGSAVDHLLIASDSGKFIILAYEASSAGWKRVHGETYAKSGLRRASPSYHLAAEPRGRAAIIGALEGAKLVYILNRDSAGKLTISSPVEANMPDVATFALVALDNSFNNPLFAAIEAPYDEAAAHAAAVPSSPPPLQLAFYELDLGLNHVVRHDPLPLPHSAHELIPVPGGEFGPSGVLVAYQGGMAWMNEGYPALHAAFPAPCGADLVVAHASHLQPSMFFMLVLTESGHLLRVSLEYEVDEATRLRVSYFDSIPLAADLAILSSGFLFAASQSSPPTLYEFLSLGEPPAPDAPDQTEFTPAAELVHLYPLDTLPSLSPLMDFAVADLAGDGVPQLVVGCGARTGAAALNVLRHGIAVSELVASPLPGTPVAVFSLTQTNAPRPADGSGGGDDDDEQAAHLAVSTAFLIFSFTNASLVLRVTDTVSECTDAGFYLDAPTLEAGTLANGVHVQVHARALLQLAVDGSVSEWKPPGGTTITHAAINRRQAVVALSSGLVLLFELDVTGVLSQTAGAELQLGPADELTCLGVEPLLPGRAKSRFAVIGLFDNTVRLLSLDPAAPFVQKSLLVLSTTPTSVAISQLRLMVEWSAAGLVHLVVGGSNGVVSHSYVDPSSGAISNTANRFLGPEPVSVSLAELGGRPLVHLGSSRSYMLFHQPGSPAESALLPLSYGGLKGAASFASALVGIGLVGIAGNELKIFSLERIDQSFNADPHPLPYTPRAVVHHPASQLFFVGMSDARAYTLQELAAAAGLDAGDPEALEASRARCERIEPGRPAAAGAWAAGLALFDGSDSSLLWWGNLSVESSGAGNEALLSLEVVTFSSDPSRIFAVAGVAVDFEPPRTATSFLLRTFELVSEGDAVGLVHVHDTAVPGLPAALHAFGGLLFAGAGNQLVVFDMGKTRLLRKTHLEGFPSLVVAISSDAETSRVVVADARDSIRALAWEPALHGLRLIADDTLPRAMSRAHMIDGSTVVCGDRFGNLFVARLPDDDALGTGSSDSIAHFDVVNHFYAGEPVTAITAAALQSFSGADKAVLYSTIAGAVGALVPFVTRDDVDFFLHLELHMRQRVPPLGGRDHLAFRSYYVPVKDVVDGDLCEQFMSIDSTLQWEIADAIESTPVEIVRRLEEVRARNTF